jgi:methylglyoxal synthase
MKELLTSFPLGRGTKERQIGSMTNEQNINNLVFHLSPIKDEMVKIENLKMTKILSQKGSFCPLVCPR